MKNIFSAGTLVASVLWSCGGSWRRPTPDGITTTAYGGGSCDSLYAAGCRWEQADLRRRGDPTGAGVPGLPSAHPFGWWWEPGNMGRPQPMGRTIVELYGKGIYILGDPYGINYEEENEVESSSRPRGRERVHHHAGGQQSPLLHQVHLKDGGASSGLGGPNDRAVVSHHPEGEGFTTTSLLRLCGVCTFCQAPPSSSKISKFCTTRRWLLLAEDGGGPLMLHPLAGVFQGNADGSDHDRHHQPGQPDGVGGIGGEDEPSVSRLLGPHSGGRGQRQGRVHGKDPGESAPGNGSGWKTTIGMASRGTMGHHLGPSFERQGFLVGRSSRTSHLLDSPWWKGETTYADGRTGRCNNARRQASIAGRDNGERQRDRRQEEEPGSERRQKEEATGRKGRTKQLEAKFKRWRRQGIWLQQRKRWTVRGGMLRLEQWKWPMRRTPTRRPLQSKGGEKTQVHSMRFTWASLERLSIKEEIEGWLLALLAVGCGVGDNPKTEGNQQGSDASTGRAVKGTELTKEIRDRTKRKRFTGDDPDGEDEPPKDKVHVKGDYMDFDEYLKVRHFIFVHHFCGAEDNLSAAVEEESKALGITVNTYSVDKTSGGDLLKEEPYHTHRAAAAAGEIDGYHAGFPCNTFTKLRWRPVQGLPGPVRSKDFPYGFPDLNDKEKRECNIGSVLMAKSVVIADYMFKADRRMKVPSFATLENPPPSDVVPHISAWHMPEMVDLVDRNPDWKCAHFNTCAYEEDVDLGARHYKPQMVGGNLIGIEALSKICPCGNRTHEPIVGKERSQKSAAYPPAFCREYGKLAAQHFLKIAKAEFLEGRLVVMQNRINYLKGAAADTVKDAMDVDEHTNTITKSDDYKRGLEWKEKLEAERDRKRQKGERAAEGGDRDGGTPAGGSSATSSKDLAWKGGLGKHGMLREPKAKTEVPKALVYLGGMRDPHRAVVKLPTLQSLGTKMWERWQRFRSAHPKALEVAEGYGTEDCKFNEEIVDLWRAELCDLWGAEPPGVVLRPRGTYGTPVHHGMLAAWVKKSGDPDTHVPVWLREGTPLGIEKEIQCAGIFPPAEEELEGTGTQEVADSVLERPETWTNYKSVEDDVTEAEIELARYESLGYLRRVDAKTAEDVYRGGTISRLGLVLKTKESGEKKRRIVIDLRRSGGNSKSKLPERLVLPRLTDAAKMMKEIRKRGQKPEDTGKDLELEIALVDVRDAFTVLPVAKEELKHTLAPSTKEGEVLVFQALLFGYKVA